LHTGTAEIKTVYRSSNKKYQEKLIEVEVATDLPGRIRIVQFPALPKITLLLIGVRLSEIKDSEKYLPRWPDARRTQGLTYVERHDIFSYLATRLRMPIPTRICPTHDLLYGAKPRHPRGRRKLGEKFLTYLDKEVFSSS
jgi:hypothetical protein